MSKEEIEIVISNILKQPEFKKYCKYYRLEPNKDQVAGFIIWKSLGMKIYTQNSTSKN